ncbi:UDP-2,3-diacylglucosamine diphosphatase [Emcibacter sp.]|uniref:UDP-2,3-diacylglucosamine diphosphatase n=1 Tax=Emcibacter sp. TaxID=1979954 RepID=UPI002AA78D82|nr:UDP-2,3-diacylglucosamine diphosphatase [Emcibacter sp.]
MLKENRRKYRSLFLSDIHLGTKGCKAELLLEFLKYHDADTIYLVGDIVDGWRLQKGWYWPQAHNDVVQKMLRKVRKGTTMYYVTGNHDEFLRDYLGDHFGGIEVVNEVIHEDATGKKYLVVHGDAYDGVLLNARWLAKLGDWAYETALKLNNLYNFCRRKLGFGYWSLSAYLKLKVKNAVKFMTDFEDILAQEARKRDLDGVICGHIHHAQIKMIDEIVYMNDGDWVESCTALVENTDGSFEIINWAEERKSMLNLRKDSKKSKDKDMETMVA